MWPSSLSLRWARGASISEAERPLQRWVAFFSFKVNWFKDIHIHDTLHVAWRDSITGESSNKQCNGQENGTPCIKNCRHPDCKKVITSFHNLFNLYSQNRTEKLEKKKTLSTFKRILHPIRQFKHSLWCLLSSPLGRPTLQIALLFVYLGPQSQIAFWSPSLLACRHFVELFSTKGALVVVTPRTPRFLFNFFLQAKCCKGCCKRGSALTRNGC